MLMLMLPSSWKVNREAEEAEETIMEETAFCHSVLAYLSFDFTTGAAKKRLHPNWPVLPR